MTKKDYELIQKALNFETKEQNMYNVRENAACRLARALYKKNPKFNAWKFLKGCGIDYKGDLNILLGIEQEKPIIATESERIAALEMMGLTHSDAVGAIMAEDAKAKYICERHAWYADDMPCPNDN